VVNDSVAFGLPQPHLDRTRLCELPDAELASSYRAARDALRVHLVDSARPKALRGKVLSGAGLADLVEALVFALNEREMPTAGSMLASFNQKLLLECAEDHAAALAALRLPVTEVCGCLLLLLCMTCRCHAQDTFNCKHVVEDTMHYACVNGIASTAGMKSFHVILFSNMRDPDRGLLSVAIV
jgi:hypothetical protein